MKLLAVLIFAVLIVSINGSALVDKQNEEIAQCVQEVGTSMEKLMADAQSGEVSDDMAKVAECCFKKSEIMNADGSFNISKCDEYLNQHEIDCKTDEVSCEEAEEMKILKYCLQTVKPDPAVPLDAGRKVTKCGIDKMMGAS